MPALRSVYWKLCSGVDGAVENYEALYNRACQEGDGYDGRLPAGEAEPTCSLIISGLS